MCSIAVGVWFRASSRGSGLLGIQFGIGRRESRMSGFRAQARLIGNMILKAADTAELCNSYKG